MGLFDRSSSTTQNEENTDARQVGVTDVSGVSLAQVSGGRNIITTTDQGAIDAGRDIALEGLHVGQRGLEEAGGVLTDLVNLGVEQSLETGATLRASQDRAFSFAESVQEGNERVLVDSLAATERVTDNAFGFVGDLVNQVIEVVGDSGTRLVDSIGAVQARESTNTDARLEGITRVALIGAGVVVAVGLVAPLLKD